MSARFLISANGLALVLVFGFNILKADAFFGLGKPQLLDPPDGVNVRTISTEWFEQKLDHFTPTDTRTWKQRYYVNDAYYNETTKNHIYLMIGGEAEASTRWVNYGAWMETVNQYGGLILYLEHRFYGESQPLSNLSTENLKYLSTHQALEDVASFIQGINREYNLTSEVKWIAFGGSYAGTLAAWLRQKYPHLVAGAMSSSGPLEAILDFSEYLEVVIKGMAIHSQECISNIKSAYTALEELVSSCLEETETYTELNNAFNLCESIENSEENEKDLAYLFQIITDDNFAYVVQYHEIPGVPVTINDLCEIMVNETSGKTELYRLAEVNSLLLNILGQNCTENKYDNLVSNWQNTTAVSNSMMRQWVYQTCTEFGFFQTSSQEDPIFGSRFNITFFIELCQDVFGSEFNETMINLGIQATNNRYAGKDNSASNIVYVHGTIDPWHVLGKLESSDESHRVIVIEGVSHCANMFAPQETDLPALTEARKEVNLLIGQWLGVSVHDTSDSSSNIMSNSVPVFSLLLIIYYLG